MDKAITRLGVSAVLAAATALSGCVTSSNANQPEVLEKTVSLSNCPNPAAEAGVTVFDDAAWAEHLEMAGDQLTAIDWTPDFSKQRVVLVRMGEKPTLGYAMAVEPPVPVKDSVVSMPVKASSPPAGSIVGAALTSPCAYSLINIAEFKALVVTNSADDSEMHRWEHP
ncbi:MAG: protease complex subunit PrcB family protein [Burkholderiaceae bacterium]